MLPGEVVSALPPSAPLISGRFSARDHVERLLGDWQDRVLTDLGNDPKLVIHRHRSHALAQQIVIATTEH